VATPAELGMVFDPTASAKTAYGLGRSGGLFGALAGQIKAGGFGVQIPPVIIFDQRVAFQYLGQIASQINQPVVEAGLRSGFATNVPLRHRRKLDEHLLVGRLFLQFQQQQLESTGRKRNAFQRLPR